MPLVEGENLLFIDQQIAAAAALLLLLQRGDQLPVAGHKSVLPPQLTLHQSGLDKEAAGFGRIDPGQRYLTARHHRQTEESATLQGHHLTPPLLPVGVGVAVAHQRPGQGFNPLRFDGGYGTGVKPTGLHQLRGHHPLGSPVEEGGAGEEHHRAATPALVKVLLLFQGEITQIATEQRTVNRRRGGRSFV